MKVKLAENLGRAHVALVRKAGHVAERVAEEGLSGAKDANLWQHICNEGYFFITLDLDFSDVRRFPPGTHPGILLIRARSRARSKSRAAVSFVLQQVLMTHPLNTLAGCLAVADETSTRIRRPPTTPAAP
jgi:predicted nuclease of predicted toxin-antitoxin system